VTDIERVPPHSAEAEAAVLGAMLISPEDAGVEIVATLRPEHFYQPRNRQLFGVLAAMISAAERVDGFLVRARLEARGLLDAVGGAGRLAEVADECPTPANARAYAAIVLETASLRALADAGLAIARDALDNGHDGADAVAERAEAALARVIEHRVGDDAVPLGQVIVAEAERLRRGERAACLETGLIDVDRLLGGGLRPGELCVIAGRPSMGKSALASGIARHVATAPEPVPVLYAALEVGRADLARNVSAQHAGLNAQRWRTGSMSASDVDRVQLVAAELASVPIEVIDSSRLTIATLRAKARLARIRRNVGLVVVDYLQLMDAGLSGRTNREQEIAHISRGLKQTARELGISVLALAQLNRGAEAREGHRPRLSDLRESGAIEADADVVMLLYREAYYAPGKAEVANLAEVIVAKNRNGPTGTVKLYLDRASLRFGDWREARGLPEEAMAAPPDRRWGRNGGAA